MPKEALWVNTLQCVEPTISPTLGGGPLEQSVEQYITVIALKPCCSNGALRIGLDVWRASLRVCSAERR